MTGECWRCHRTTECQTHHSILGRGKRREHETPESLYLLCVDCHRFAHGKDGHGFLDEMKMHTQSKYFAQGFAETDVRKLMGGKLVLGRDGEICGRAQKDD